MRIRGTVVSNLKRARRNIEAQSAHFVGLPHREDLYPGTVNLAIGPKRFEVLKCDYYYPEVRWKAEGDDVGMTEDFCLVKLGKLGRPGKPRQARGYLYLPSASPNRQGGEVLEVWTEFVAGLREGDELEIEIPGGRLRII